MKRLLFFGFLGLAGCSWQAAAIGIPVAAVALVGPKIATDYFYNGHAAELRAKCDDGGTFTDCAAYQAAVSSCLEHLGLFATDASKRNCEG